MRPARRKCLLIFDRDGTITYSPLFRAIQLAWKKAAEDFPPEVPEAFKAEPTTQELYDVFSAHVERNPETITKEKIAQLIAHRYPHPKPLYLSDIEDEITRLSLAILDQSKIENQLLQAEKGLSRALAREVAIDYFVDVPRDEEERQEWRDFNRKLFAESLDVTEAEAWINACEKGDFETAARINFKRERVLLEKEIELLKEKLSREKVFEPYTMQMGFAPDVLNTLRTLKNQGHIISIVTSGGRHKEEQLFSGYMRRQFKVALEINEPNDFFDSQIAALSRSKAFANEIQRFGIDKCDVYAIGDDVTSIADHAKIAGISPIVINWQRELGPETDWGKNKKTELEAAGVQFIEHFSELPAIIAERRRSGLRKPRGKTSPSGPLGR